MGHLGFSMPSRFLATTVLLVAGSAGVNHHDPWPPRTAGMSYPEAVAALHGWCPDLRIKVVPRGIPADADEGLLFVKLVSFSYTKRGVEAPVLAAPSGAGDVTCGPDRPGLSASLSLFAEVPDLAGKDLTTARTELAARGIRLTVSSGPAKIGSIVERQAPPPGVAIDIDDTPYVSKVVTVTATVVAASPRMPALLPVQVRVPDVRNMNEDNACLALERERLVCRVDAGRDDASAGRVVSQDPPPGTVVDAGTSVAVRVPRDDPTKMPAADGSGRAARPSMAVLGTGGAALLAVLALVTIRKVRAPRRPATGPPADPPWLDLPVIEAVPHQTRARLSLIERADVPSYAVGLLPRTPSPVLHLQESEYRHGPDD